MYGPVIDGVMVKDHLIYLVRQGHIRPNTPISQNYAKDDSWGFINEAYDTMTEHFATETQQEQIEIALETSGSVAPAPWQNRMFEVFVYVGLGLSSYGFLGYGCLF